MIFLIIGIAFIILFVIPFISGYTGNYKLAKYYGVTYAVVEKQEETNKKEELKEINRGERVELLENTLVHYNRLIDLLTEQYKMETNEKKKAALLRQKITALEKYNKALEKMEKMDI